MQISENSVGGDCAPSRKPGSLSSNLRSLLSSDQRAARVGHQIHSPETIKAILHRECARCERSGSEFCLIMIDPGPDAMALNRLGLLLSGHVRQADEIGFMDENRLCVLLTYTVPAGAELFMGRFMQLAEAIGEKPITELYVYPSADPDDRDKDKSQVSLRSIPTDANLRTSDEATVNTDGVETFLARKPPVWKRAMDIIGAGAAILMLWPLGLMIAILIRFTSKGPVFFRQSRMGLGGRPFRIFKFRTMVADADQRKATLLHQNEQDGPAFKMRCDPRITRIGSFLRKTSLDELPQFLNVMLGEMSLVGPRPLPIDEAMACRTWQKRRLDVLPGLTCTWQISGRGKVTFSEWARMDREYIRRQSFMYDAKLLALTVPAVLARRGAM